VKVNFLKRLESSVHAFALTMERTITKIGALESRLQTFQAAHTASPALDLEDLDDAAPLPEFTLDDFRVDLLNYLAANRTKLEEAPTGIYTVTPPPAGEHTVAPSVIFCLRQRSAESNRPSSAREINPLQPYYLVYVLDDGNVRLGFAQPKQALALLRELCAGVTTAYDDLCAAFDAATQDGQAMAHYTRLLERAVAAIAATFQRRMATALQSSRSAVLPALAEQVQEK